MPKPSTIVGFGIFDFSPNPTLLIVGDSGGLALLVRHLEVLVPQSRLLPDWFQPLNGYDLIVQHTASRSELSVTGLVIDWKISSEAAGEYSTLLRALSAHHGPAHQFLPIDKTSAHEIRVSKDEYAADFFRQV
ncbi:hypothetical protein [Dongia sp.]|uniref:hypothetical protein n=1 Tax=Dongia sp. TaxID=1977262 RepID=UPI0035ADD3E4